MSSNIKILLMPFFSKKIRFKVNIRSKILIFIFIAFSIITGAILSYITISNRRLAEHNATELAITYAGKYANSIQTQLNTQIGMAQSFAHSIQSFPELPTKQMKSIQRKMLYDLINKNQKILAIWINWERRLLDSTWSLPYGRKRFTYFKEFKTFKYKEEGLDNNGDNISGDYYKMKVSKKETILNPYTYSYSGREDEAIFETSLCIPIIKDNEFMGLAGVDISLEIYQNIINNFDAIEGSQAFLISNIGTLVTHPNKKNIGKNILEIDKNFSDTSSVIKNIQSGKHFSYSIDDDNKNFYTFYPIQIGNTKTPWSLFLKVPLKSIISQNNQNLINSIMMGLIAFLILGIFIWLISGHITKPIKYTTKTLQRLALGDLENTTKLEISTNDELQEMADSMNTLMDGLKNTANFARKIGKGDLDAQYNILSKKDTLGQALLEMQKNLRKAKKQEEQRQETEYKQNWITEGQASIGDILRKNDCNIKELSYNLLKHLIDYTETTQGCIYVKKEDSDKDEFELSSAIAYDKRKLLKDVIRPGDGLVGRVLHEKLTIYITDIPDDYVKITSGLGGANPRSILIVPLIINDAVFGALELISLHKFEKYRIEFIEKIAESIASTIASAKTTERTTRLLKESQIQQEELSSQEEEMRQNLEELKATQEEATRKENEVNAIIEALGSIVLITEFNLDGFITNINKKCSELLGFSPDKMIGKHHKKMGLDHDRDEKEYKNLWTALKLGKTKDRISETTVRGLKRFIKETYIPLEDTNGNIHRVIALGLDFTKNKERDKTIEELNKQIDKLKNK